MSVQPMALLSQTQRDRETETDSERQNPHRAPARAHARTPSWLQIPQHPFGRAYVPSATPAAMRDSPNERGVSQPVSDTPGKRPAPGSWTPPGRQAKWHEASSSSSRGASQPVTDGASQPADASPSTCWQAKYLLANIELVSYNVGVNQQLLASNKATWHEDRKCWTDPIGPKLGNIVDKFFTAGLNFVFLSALGDYRKGVPALDQDHHISIMFGVGPDSIQGAHCGLVGRGTEATLAAEGTKATETLLRVDMYWQAYLVERPVVGGASQSANVVFGLIVGNAHIATSQQPLKPSITSKKYITTEFLNYLSRLEAFTDAEGSPHLSVVRVLLGDMDLTVAQGWESVQDAAVPICGLPIQRAGGELAPWRITTTDAALSGDLMFSSGAAATPKTVPVGTSYGKNAVTKKWHDAVSAELLVPCEVIDASGAPQTASPERRSSACLPQPASACLPQPRPSGASADAPLHPFPGFPCPSPERPSVGDLRCHEALSSSSRGASQPVTRGASQPAKATPSSCWPAKYLLANVELVSYNVGINQQILASNKATWHLDRKSWADPPSDKLDKLVNKFFAGGSNFVFLSALGDYRKGVPALDQDHDLRDMFGVGPDSIQGAYCGLVGPGTKTTLAKEGLIATDAGFEADMHWQAYLVERPGVGGASQPADGPHNVTFGLIVGNVHIAMSQQPKPSITARQTITKTFLNSLALLTPFGPPQVPDLSVVHVLLGDVNLTLAHARQTLQDAVEPICGLPIQRMDGELAPWRVITTVAAFPGDLMFTTGAAVTAKTVPVGASYGNHAVSQSRHDAVAAKLLVPCEVIDASGAPRAARRGSPEQRASACLPQPACLSLLEARVLDGEMPIGRSAETNAIASEELCHMLYSKRGSVRGEATVRVLSTLLAIRHAFLDEHGIRAHAFLALKDAQRTAILKQWKERFHSTPLQQDLQRRDASMKGDRRTKGKHSRWSRHLQREFGSKSIAECVVFTGRLLDPGMLRILEDSDK